MRAWSPIGVVLMAAVLSLSSEVGSGSPAPAADEVGDEAGPAGLVGGAEPGAGVAVEVLVEQQPVVQGRVGLELLGRSERRAATVGVVEEGR